MDRLPLLALLHLPRELLGKEDRVYVGQHTTFRDGHALQQLVQLLVVADCQLNVAGGDTLLFVVAASVPGQLQNLGAQVLFCWIVARSVGCFG